WKQILLDREEWLADRGIRYLLIPPPNKIMIYPEFLPDRIRKRAGKTNLEQFLEYLAEPPIFRSVIDLRPPLLAAKKEHQVYFKGDTHWNLEGAYVGYVAIMNAIRRWFPEMKPVPREQMVKTPKQLSGDLTYTLNLADRYRETYLFLSPPNAEEVIRYEKFAGYPQPDTADQKFRRGVLFTNENPLQQRTALFISDSFGSAMRDFLAPHFKRIIFVKNARFEDMKRLIEIEKPDIVFDLNVARGLYVAMGENIEIRDYILKKHHSSRSTVVDITTENFRTKLSGSAQVDLLEGQGATLQAYGIDPQLYFDLSQQTSNDNLSIYCEITSPASTPFRIYYQTKDQPYYSGEKMVSHPLRAGRNSFYLRIYEPILFGSIRVDPGELPGRYALNKLTISSESSPRL
ncbi:MAG: alginate O-acetyltransferase AlgX-related protein, partial [Desulforhopalus sp.]